MSIICPGLPYQETIELVNIVPIVDFITGLCRNAFDTIIKDPEHRLNRLIGSLRIDDFRTTTPLDCVTGLLRMLILALAGVAPKSTPLLTAISRRPRKSRT